MGEGYEQVLCIDPPERRKDFEKLFPGIFVQEQRGTDLGDRIQNAFAESFSRGAREVIVIGSDCLGVDRKALKEGFQRLEGADLVLGPAADGGYYLIGLKKEEPDLFRDIAWSTDRVFEQTKDRAQGLHLRVKILPILSDLDEIR